MGVGTHPLTHDMCPEEGATEPGTSAMCGKVGKSTYTSESIIQPDRKADLVCLLSTSRMRKEHCHHQADPTCFGQSVEVVLPDGATDCSDNRQPPFYLSLRRTHRHCPLQCISGPLHLCSRPPGHQELRRSNYLVPPCDVHSSTDTPSGFDAQVSLDRVVQ